MEQNPRYDEAVRRAALPELLFAPDLALATNLTTEEADRAARLGSFGPTFYIKGEVAVLRQDFLDFIRKRAKALHADERELLP